MAVTTPRLFMMLSVSALAVLSAVGKNRKVARHQEKKQHKKELSTWEGEGGNLPPQSMMIHSLASSQMNNYS